MPDVIATENYTFKVCAVRLVVAQFIARLPKEQVLLAIGSHDLEIAPTIVNSISTLNSGDPKLLAYKGWCAVHTLQNEIRIP